jgi:hypothetical protein
LIELPVQRFVVSRRQPGLEPSHRGTSPAAARVTSITQSSAADVAAPLRQKAHQRVPSPVAVSWFEQLEVPEPVS